jgi:hypothetical protein
VAGELLPLKCLVAVDVDLPEELDEVLDEPDHVPRLGQVMQHDLDEVSHREAFLLLLEVFLDLLELAVVQVAHDIVIFILLL